jgi:hypothetical protein
LVRSAIYRRRRRAPTQRKALFLATWCGRINRPKIAR